MCLRVCVCTLIIHVWFLFSNEIDIQKLSVYLGKSAINETDAEREQSFIVEKVVLHEKYNDSNYNNDIGVNNCSLCQCVCLCVCVRLCGE